MLLFGPPVSLCHNLPFFPLQQGGNLVDVFKFELVI
jgi:hypothetical protein